MIEELPRATKEELKTIELNTPILFKVSRGTNYYYKHTTVGALLKLMNSEKREDYPYIRLGNKHIENTLKDKLT